MRVGVITLYGLFNYGNRLQNYAVHSILSRMGYDVKSYSTHMYFFEIYGVKYKLKKIIHKFTRYRFSKDLYGCAENSRKASFEKFTKKFISTEKVFELEKLDDKADYFVLGSDQVWNPTFYKDNSDWDLYSLKFTKPSKKICLAPSFGVSELKEEWIKQFEELLPTFPEISVREKTGADLIEDITGQKAFVMIDPTLMVDTNEWKKIEKKPYGVDTKKPYILTYFLGKRTEQFIRDLQEINTDEKYKIYNLNDISQPFVYAAGPREFLYLISHASLVLTDSFHACVFSFLFNRPFAVYVRHDNNVDMETRVASLLKMLHLEHKYRCNNEIVEWFENDYHEGKDIIASEREKAYLFLKKQMM